MNNTDTLFNILLHIDDKSLARLKVVNSHLNNDINKILDDDYFWYMKEKLRLQQNALNNQWFVNRKKYLVDYDYDKINNDYLDEYILPSRYIDDQEFEEDDFIYRRSSLTRQELDDELYDIEHHLY